MNAATNWTRNPAMRSARPTVETFPRDKLQISRSRPATSTPNPTRFTQPDQVMDLLYVVRILVDVYLRGGGRIGRPGEELLGVFGIAENMNRVLVLMIGDIPHRGCQYPMLTPRSFAHPEIVSSTFTRAYAFPPTSATAIPPAFWCCSDIKRG